MPQPSEELRLPEEERQKLAYVICPHRMKECWGQCMFYDGEGTPCRNPLIEEVLKFFSSLGYRSPSEVKEIEKRAREEVIGEVESFVNGTMAFINETKRKYGKGQSYSLLLTIKDSAQDFIAYLKQANTSQKGEG